MNPELSCENQLLDSKETVLGLIYEIVNTTSGTKYVGQTVTHRLNRGKYRPFGIEGRLKDHISEATNNTKRKQCSYLNNAIRKNGPTAFTVTLLKTCTLDELDTFEQHYIKELNTLYPNGYNLTKGGKTMYIETKLEKHLLSEPKLRGGCVFRTAQTRQKMSARLKELATPEWRRERAEKTQEQHREAKLALFKNCKIDMTIVDNYIRKKGDVIVVQIDDIRTSFGGKHESLENARKRAHAFIEELHKATLSNCGKPVKPE